MIEAPRWVEKAVHFDLLLAVVTWPKVGEARFTRCPTR